MVVGYAVGTYDADNVRYLVTEADAHAWVEVYFPEYGWAADAWRLRLLTPVAAMATLYRRLQHHGRRLAVPMREGDTPYEFATSFAEHIAGLVRGKSWDTALAPAVREARQLVSLYVQASYTPRSPNSDDQRQAIQTWRWLRRRLWVTWVLQRWWRSPPRRFVKTLNASGLAYRR